jgi:hypothetical protein
VAISLKIYEGPLQDLNKIGHNKRVGQLLQGVDISLIFLQ